MKLAIEILAWVGAFTLVTSAVFALALWGAAREETRDAQRRLEAMRRHPAGERRPANGCDGWTSPRFPFRARPCRHLLYAPSRDEVEHLELLHISSCVIALELLPDRKDAR